MNVKEYISSGIVEAYVLGIATDAEREELETMCKLHPEVEQARLHFELLMENRLQQEAVQPPSGLKDRVQEIIANEQTGNASDAEEKTATPVRRLSLWKITAAASVVLLAGAVFWAITLTTRYNKAQQAANELRRQLTNAEAKVRELEKTAQTLQTPALKTATLLGTQNAPGSFANVYWDTTTKDVYLLINNMPQPASGRQYQLWALIDNQPIDLGVIDQHVWQEKLLVKMKNVHNAEAFAITLEPKGGSPSPTLEAMYVVGRL